MNDLAKTALCIAGTMVLIFADVLLLTYTNMSITVFWVIIVLAIALSFLPLIFVRGFTAELNLLSLKVKAPFVDLDIVYSDIQSLELRMKFSPGIRVWGYGAIHKGAGQFDNKEFGTYTFSGDTRIPAFIVVRYSGNRILVFNAVDEGHTRSLYDSLKSATGKSGSEMFEGPVQPKSRRKLVVAVAAVGVIAAVVILIFALTGMGHVNAALETDHLHVDAIMVNENIAYTDIDNAELRENLDYGSRIGGFGGSEYLSGKFRNAEFGTYRLAVHKDVSECIVVHHHGGVLVFNLGSNAATEAFLTDLQSRL